MGKKEMILPLLVERKAELEEAITDKTKVVIMPFPNNPTGAIMERKDLEAEPK